MHYTKVFISDLHIGVQHNNLGKLLAFLKDNTFEDIYLVGDIIDGWVLKQNFAWDAEYNTFVQKILRLSRKGTNVFYIPGNHDAFMDTYIGTEFGGIQIKENIIIETKNHESILVMHGDELDRVMKYSPLIQIIGGHIYNISLDITMWFNRLCKLFNYKSNWSLTNYIKTKTKEALNYVDAFERLAIEYAKEQGVSGILCGHIHQAAQKTIDGIKYYNTGTFIDNPTLIVENEDGIYELLHL